MGGDETSRSQEARASIVGGADSGSPQVDGPEEGPGSLSQGVRDEDGTLAVPAVEVALTDAERDELRQLRAEKVAWERAELERLRVEQRQRREREHKTGTRVASGPAVEVSHEEAVRIANARKRGARLMVPDEETLGMPPGQKVVLAVIFTLAIVAALMLIIRR